MNKSISNLLRIIGSVLAAAVGIQSAQNRNRDFQANTSVTVYVLAGLIFTLIFVLIVYAIVKIVLN